ncbi:MAG: hypothetical protein ABIZ70_08400 [Gemmatimonadales bacterium]
MTILRYLSVLLLVTVSTPTPAAAQRETLTSGRWRGEISPLGDTPYRVGWVVTNDKKGSHIELRIFNAPSTVMGGVRLKGSRLTFTWAAGGARPFFCTLYRDGDGSFSGACDDPVIGDTGQHITADVTMWPPGMRPPKEP